MTVAAAVIAAAVAASTCAAAFIATAPAAMFKLALIAAVWSIETCPLSRSGVTRAPAATAVEPTGNVCGRPGRWVCLSMLVFAESFVELLLDSVSG